MVEMFNKTLFSQIMTNESVESWRRYYFILSNENNLKI
jgi:hypothetical protein